MIRHIKYNYRTDQNGNALYDYFTVGEEAQYQLNVMDVLTFKVTHIMVNEDGTADVGVTSPDGDFLIGVSGVSSVLQQFDKI